MVKCVRCLGKVDKKDWALFETQYYHSNCLRRLKIELRERNYKTNGYPSWAEKPIVGYSKRKFKASGRKDD